MKKTGALSLLAEMKAESEMKSAEDLELMPMRIVELLLEYINDPHIRQAVDEINF